MQKLKKYSLCQCTNAYYCSGLYSLSCVVLVFYTWEQQTQQNCSWPGSVQLHCELLNKDALCREVSINGKYNVLSRFYRLVHFNRCSSGMFNERNRYILNKWKCVTVACCLIVTNKVSIPSYNLQVPNQMSIKFTLQK